MATLVNQGEVKEMFKEFVARNEIKLKKRVNFKNFLKYLEIDFWDWIRENLRYYFRERT